MRGNNEIIEMRMDGFAPSCVFIDDYNLNWDIANALYEDEEDSHVVCVYGDNPRTLDLSFLVGLDVRITSTTERRAKALFDSAVKNGAKSVASYSCTGRGNGKMLIYIDGKSQSF
jgi:hypothetical protein